MTTLREAAQQALEALCAGRRRELEPRQESDAIAALKAALAEPVEFDHGVGADRFKVVRGAFWWHVLIGDSPIKHGKFHSRAGAEEMAALLLREFRNGAFVQHKAALAEPEPRNQCGETCERAKLCAVCARALAEPVQEPVAWLYRGNLHATDPSGWCIGCPTPLYTAPPQRKPLTVEKIVHIIDDTLEGGSSLVDVARAIERAHGIGGQDESA